MLLMRTMRDQQRGNSGLSRNAHDFIDDAALHESLGQSADAGRVREIIAKSLAKEALTVAEAAALVNTTDPELVESIFAAARQLKRDVYGNRIVLFAPLYIGNECVNDCAYCGFRRANTDAIRRTLDVQEIRAQVSALERGGHKRLILVFGEHPAYTAEFMADAVRTVYAVTEGHSEIRRVNLNAAPLDHAGFRTVKAAGIGTYQIFQETYHHPTYADVHPWGTSKSDYLWRLDALDRAYESGCDDVGIGALFGLYDWRFEVLGLVAHARHLVDKFHCGPHTISFPRLRPASGVKLEERWRVSDDEFKRLVAILRLSVPYTGMILTAREPAALREQLLGFGVSQIDAGSRIELGAYAEAGDSQQQVREREQFELGDVRTLDEVVRQLLVDGYLPSFCTACYRLGRTGEQFMEYAIPGFIERLCTPNALTTLKEYLMDHASPATRELGERLIRQELAKLPPGPDKQELLQRLERIETTDQRDLYY
jgi:2-iminoacetate synthase